MKKAKSGSFEIGGPVNNSGPVPPKSILNHPLFVTQMKKLLL
jgi:hypothetical protein